ncbi:hypothetical protein M408DRAFT_332002 [Serendipita vermifera MAFF 305830]|uniref:ABC1 atypical kinase-like domain-containing protein n=1 Tax=Serendipita vermifera MAFF 305830 TaxID=933852 RepID=A0A0C3AY33_SERVB|nr:hypothetical protein M408DRAFT_332002 [Serendipita vermifera MAFF 305830]
MQGYGGRFLKPTCRLSSSPLSFSGRKVPNQTNLGIRLGKHNINFSRKNANYAPIKGSRRSIWVKYAVTLTLGGAAVYATRGSSNSFIHTMTNSPACIPTVSPSVRTPLIASAPETSLSFLSHIAKLLRKYIFSPLRTGLRFLHLVIIFSPVLFTAPMLFVGKAEPEHGGEGWGALWWYDRLTRSMQRAGPTFIKLAQWAASRRDLFSLEFCSRLGSLHSTTEPHSLGYTIAVVEKVFRRSFTDVFESFDPTPIGSGAIAQVYRAVIRPHLLPPSFKDDHPLHTTRAEAAKIPLPPLSQASSEGADPVELPPTVVAVKVLHPHVGDMIRRDLAIMTFFARMLSLIPGVQWLSLDQEVAVFGEMMNEQLDLRHEADNLDRFIKNFQKRRAAVSFPKPLMEYTSHDLLVEEFQYAVPLGAFLRNGAGPYNRPIGTIGLDAFLNMLLLDNFVHADLHPGNILVKFCKPTTAFVLKSIAASLFNLAPPTDPINTPDADKVVSSLMEIREKFRKTNRKGDSESSASDRAKAQEEWKAELSRLEREGYQPELVFLDAGLVTTLSETNRRNFLELFRAIASFDGYRAGQLMIMRSESPELSIDPETFALKMQHLVLSVKAKTFTLGQIRISDVLSDVLKFVREHHVKMQGDFVNTIISVLLLEGIGRQLDPDMDLFKSALPILRQLGRQVSAKDAIQEGASGNVASMFKFWVWLEAREFINTAIINVDELIDTDWLSPNI